MAHRLHSKSCMSRDVHVQFCEGLWGKLPRATRLILFSNDKAELRCHLEKIRYFLSNELKFNLKEKVVRISPVSEGLPFLGYRIYRGTIRLQRANLVRFRRNIIRLEKKFLKGKIEQEDLTNSVRSVIAHVSHGNTRNFRKTVFFR